MDIWFVYDFWLLWIMLLWTFMYPFLCGQSVSILLGIYQGVGFMDHLVTSYWTFWRIAKTFSKAGTAFYIPTSNIWGFHFLHILLLSFFFFKASWHSIAACQILIPQLGIELMPPPVEEWSLNRWTTREVPCRPFWLKPPYWMWNSISSWYWLAFPPDPKHQLIGKDPDAGKDWRQKEKRATEGEIVR